ncbi:MAG TPA: biotin-dependent carboxyltransferase family protein [Acetobacteraceae bacterium]|nr:biotin-dependent carboxyltransferase family protein [Acetobacteraceae bacterium]
MAGLRVLAAGPLSTVQDTGRFGHQRFGVSTAGAFDPLYLAAGNALVGNRWDEGAVEMTLRGETWEVLAESCRVGIAGDFDVSIGDRQVASWRTHTLHRGDVLRIGAARRRDVRGYFAVAGGFAVPPVLGSVSTHIRTRLGGVEGRPLKSGDFLPLRDAVAPNKADLMLARAALPRRDAVLRVVLGPQDDHFTAAWLETFFSAEFSISPESDRMGCRLAGPVIEHDRARGYNIISDGIPPGAVQVPGTGLPIVLGPDRQTTGGYPKIACVILPDVAALAQRRPGDRLRFRAISEEEARAAHLGFRRLLAEELPRRTAPAGADALRSERLLALNLIGGVVDAGGVGLEETAGPQPSRSGHGYHRRTG